MLKMNLWSPRCWRVLLLVSGICLVSGNVFAASFQSLEQSAARLGTADSGTATDYSDAAIQYYNPGAMAFITKPEMSISGILVAPNISFHPNSATNYDGDAFSGNAAGPGVDAVVPGLYYVQPVGERAVFGFGITIPYGLETKYNDDSMARYFATESSMTVININPSLGFRFTDNFGFGFGVDAQRMSAELDQAFDAGSYFTAYRGTDIIVKNRGNSWGYGWNAGAYYNLSPIMHVGLAYHSRVIHNFDGDSTPYCDDPVVLDLAKIMLGLQQTDAYSEIKLPETLTLSFQADFTPRLTGLMDIEYVHWRLLKDLTLTFGQGDPDMAAPPASIVIPLRYHDTVRVAIGQKYKFSDKLTLRAGLAFDQTPTDNIYRTARIPDGNRYWVALGANYTFTPKISLDVGYGFVLFEPSRIHQEVTSDLLQKQVSLDANYTGNAHLLGIQLNLRG